MNNKSWDHSISTTTPQYDVAMERVVETKIVDLGWKCSHPRCPNRAAYECSYRYVTGRAGRTTTRLKPCCMEHAAEFAAKHGLQLPSGKDAAR